MGTFLAIDGGRTSCRLSLDGQEPVSGPGLPPAGAGAGAILDTLRAAIPPGLTVEGTVCAGLAGLLGRPDLAPDVATGLARRLGARRVLVTGDAVTAYAGALGLEPGVVVVAGTGAVVLGAGGGATERVDGWGHLLGDAGSGFWIGRRGLESALRAADGRGGSPLLADLARRHFGPLEHLPGQAGTSPAVVAGFAPLVAEAALDGDPDARQIWADAATELARSAAACAQRVSRDGRPVAVSWSGGLFAADRSLLLDAFLDRLTGRLPHAVPTPPAGDALAGAGRLARAAVEPGGPGLLSPAIYDTSRPPAPCLSATTPA